jgi:hypothetical protein
MAAVYPHSANQDAASDVAASRRFLSAGFRGAWQRVSVRSVKPWESNTTLDYPDGSS